MSVRLPPVSAIHQQKTGISKPSDPPLKFDNDFDFEKANEQFKETLGPAADIKKVVDKKEGMSLTRNYISNYAISDETNPESKDADSSELPDKKKDSHEKKGKKDEPTDASYYDQKSSFFDSISCENRDR